MNSNNITDLRSFLNFLSGNEKEVFTYALFDKASKKPLPGSGVLFGTIDDIVAILGTIDCTVHVTLNVTSDKGRKTADIVSSRVFCVDIDRVVSDEELKQLRDEYSPGLIVESSPGKYHLYWKVSPINLEYWSQVQLALGYRFQGDLNMAQASKMIRCPGVTRLTKTGEHYTPKIVWLDPEHKELSYDDVGKLFPFIDESLVKANALVKAERKQLSDALRAVKRGATPDMSQVQGGGRNASLYYVVKKLVADITKEVTEAEALEFADAFNAQFDKPLDKAEVTKAALSAYRHGEWVREKRRERMDRMLDPVGDGDSVSAETQLTQAQRSEATKLEATKEASLEATREAIALKEAEVAKEVPPVPINFTYDKTHPYFAAGAYNESALAGRVLQRFRDYLLDVEGRTYAFSTKTKTWVVQEFHTAKEVTSMCHKCAFEMLREEGFIKEHCTNESGDVSPSKYRMAKQRYTSVRLIKNVVSLILSSDLMVKGSVEMFDAAGELIYLGNGVLNVAVENGELGVREARAKDYLLSRSRTEWKGIDADCSGWLQFLGEVFAENDDPQAMIGFMQELFGYCLTPSIKEQKIFCHYGSGANGKSKVLSALNHISGNYATYIDPDELSKKKGSFSKSFERFGAKIEGKRLAIIDDIDVATVWNEGFVKNATSPFIRARAEYERSRQSVNRCKIHLGLNVAPSPESENHGIIRRLCLIPYPRRFEHTVEASTRIDNIIEREASGILAWAVRGWRRVNLSGLNYPKETFLALEEYRSENFKVEGLIKEMFDKPEKDTEDVFLNDVLADVNQRLREEGAGIILKPHELARLFKEMFRTTFYEKKWCPLRKNAFRYGKVKLLYKKDTPSSLL